MIQASHNKIETKAQAKSVAEVLSNSKKAVKGESLEASGETAEFAKELEATISGDAQVQPVQVSAEQALELPSALIQPSGTVGTTSQKVFDPELTKGVEKLIDPTTSEVAAPTDAQLKELLATKTNVNPNAQMNVEAMASAEIPAEMETELDQSMLKTPQVAQSVNGRAPAIEFAQTEVDPQLLNNEDFLAQKNLFSKKTASNAYGMKAVPAQQHNVAMEAGLRDTQVVKDLAAAQSENASMNSQQFILGLQTEPALGQTNETQAPAKVFDMSSVKSSQPTEIMNQITNYVVQAKAAKEPTVNMRVNHEELGLIDITVSKSGVGQDAIAINIGTHSVDGKNFFQQNSKDLFSHLTTAGLNISDLKVETPTQTAKNEFDFGSQSGKNQHGSEKQFGSEQNQRRHESDRRQELWKLLNKEAA